MQRVLPMLFSASMVQAIILGRKTQTRRLVNWKNLHKQAGLPYPTKCRLAYFNVIDNWGLDAGDDLMREVNASYRKGDILYVRENWKFTGWDYEGGQALIRYADGKKHWWDVPDEKLDWLVKQSEKHIDAGYFTPNEKTERCEPNDKVIPFHPSIHLPKWASRIWLKVTGVRVERVQDISEVDAVKEGVYLDADVTPDGYTVHGMIHWPTAKEAFMALWEEINGKEGVDANPWVWAYEFEVLSTTGKPETLLEISAAA